MLEYDVIFDSPDDEVERLRRENDLLKREYVILYNALMGELEEQKAIKRHMMDRYTKDSNDIDQRIQSIKNAKFRTLGKKEDK